LATTQNGRTARAEAEAEAAAESLGPEADLVLSTADPIGLLGALGNAGLALVKQPGKAVDACTRFAGDLVAAAAATGARMLGASVEGPAKPAAKDRRFADRTWQESPAYYFLMQSYLLGGRLIGDLVEAAALDPMEAAKADFAAQQILDALAPTNTLLNPAARKRALETGGGSIVRGVRNFLADVAENDGMPRQLDRTKFTVGKNIATTPGKVVLRNGLMELIQYEAQTDTVYEVPLVCSPPWINKYYIMDLAPGRSFVEWAVQHGHTVFAISYRNPDESMRDVKLDDYLLRGPRAALEAIEEITGTKRTNVVGLCLGGTLTSMLLAYLAKVDEARVNSATLLNTLLDFSEPGVLKAFTDERTITRIEGEMAERGYLDASQMATTFTMLRANDLIWNYFVNNWLLGADPPAFDLLAWNDDDTRMPAAMHSFYLRSCYQRNDFAGGRLELAGEVLSPELIDADVYLLSAIEDHIAPWRAGYASTQVLRNASSRYVLSTSGHIAGIVNPPSPKAAYWTNEQLPPDPDAWLGSATKHQGTWWDDWTAWISERAGAKQEPPPLGSNAHPPLGDAPGTYVHER
jgi:polyhydroxyalkanoate synthase subunit PhaC